MVKNLTPLPPPSTSIRNWPIFRKFGRGRLFFSSSPTPSPWIINFNFSRQKWTLHPPCRVLLAPGLFVNIGNNHLLLYLMSNRAPHCFNHAGILRIHPHIYENITIPSVIYCCIASVSLNILRPTSGYDSTQGASYVQGHVEIHFAGQWGYICKFKMIL